MGAIQGTEMAIKSATHNLTTPVNPSLLVICTASTNGLVPADSDMAPVYVASKFGIVGFVRSLKILSCRFNVRVNAICPVTVLTPMTEQLLSPEVQLYLQEDTRGGVLLPSACALALLRIIDDNVLAGEVVTVHPDSGPGGRVETLDPFGQFAYLGKWREDDGCEADKTKEFVDAGFASIKDGSTIAFSGI